MQKNIKKAVIFRKSVNRKSGYFCQKAPSVKKFSLRNLPFLKQEIGFQISKRQAARFSGPINNHWNFKNIII